jgi:hypothetical protein
MNIVTLTAPFSALQWFASIFEYDLILYRGSTYRIAASASHNFLRTGDTFRFEVRKGDQYSGLGWTDPVGNERSEMGETSTHSLSSADNHFHANYKLMIEPGAQNTSPWLVTGQLFVRDASGWGGTPPFEIKFMGNDKMGVVIKSGSASSPVERTIYLDTANIQRGKWYDMQIDVKFDPSGNNGGHAYVWRDGVKIANYNGKIGYNEQTQMHWEMGAYRKTPAGGESFAINYRDIDLTYGANGHSDGINPASVLLPSAP